MWFLSHKSLLKTEYFCRDHIALSLLPVGLKRASLFLQEEKVLQHMLTPNNLTVLFPDFAAQQGLKILMFSLLLAFLKKILWIPTSAKDWKRILKTQKDRFCQSFVLRCTEKTFHHYFWNSCSCCRFRVLFNLKGMPQMLKLLAISCNVSFCDLSFFFF